MYTKDGHSALEDETTMLFTKSGTNHPATRNHNAEDGRPQQYRTKNLKIRTGFTVIDYYRSQPS